MSIDKITNSIICGDLPDKKYQIIYADPPWQYSDKMKGHQGAETHYRTMPKQDICSLPVQELAESDCVLFLWATSPLLPEAIEVIKAWGFKYKTVAFCWVKETSLFQRTVANMGRWTMGGMELCLLGTKGGLRRKSNNTKQILHDIRSRHSKKPHEIRKRIIELMGNLPRIELFAREKTDGWDVWGNEVESDIDLKSYQKGL